MSNNNYTRADSSSCWILKNYSWRYYTNTFGCSHFKGKDKDIYYLFRSIYLLNGKLVNSRNRFRQANAENLLTPGRDYIIRSIPRTGGIDDMICNFPAAVIIAKYIYHPELIEAADLYIILQHYNISFFNVVWTIVKEYPQYVDHEDEKGYRPIHYAAKFASVQALQMIAEANMDNMSAATTDLVLSIAHMAVIGLRIENLRYIHSIHPDLLLKEDSEGRLPISYLSLPIIISEMEIKDFMDPMSRRSEILRFLVTVWPSIIEEKSYPYFGEDGFVERKGLRIIYDNIITKVNYSVNLEYPLRLLLMTGDPSLSDPQTLKTLIDLNYSARKIALFVFFRHDYGMDIFSRIRKGPGGIELIRIITTFL